MESSALPTPTWASSLVALLLDGAQPGDLLPSGARLDAVNAPQDGVRLVMSRDAASVVAWLKPRAAGGGAYRTTVHFLLGHEGASLDAAGRRLLDELHAAIVSREAALPASLLAAMGARTPTTGSDIPLDWLAVRAGVKPASRHVLHGAGIADLVASVGRHGLHAIAVDATDYLASFATGGAAGCDTLLYVGATPEAARAAVDAEHARMVAAALGRALGYPECCIAFFTPRCDLPNARLRFEALRRTGGSAFALLNDLDPRRSLVWHFVCRYDCTASLRSARAVFDAVDAVDAARAGELARALEGVLILFREGGALQLADVSVAGEDRYVYRSVAVHGELAAEERWREVLEHADEVRIGRDELAAFHDGERRGALPFDAERVQVRPFVRAP
jgi:hypothetical protein